MIRQTPLLRSGYFIEVPTKDALSNVLYVTVYIGLMFLKGIEQLESFLATLLKRLISYERHGV